MQQFFSNLESFLKQYLNFDWESFLTACLSAGIKLIVFVITATIIKSILISISNHSFRNYLSRKTSTFNRSKTLMKLVENCIQYLYYFVLIYGILSLLGLPVSSLLAGAGIAGIAIGLGAQGFLTDVINGFFILLEHQFDVGDTLTIDTYVGTVTNVGLRSTQLTGFDGTIYYIPNRQILVVGNSSQGHMRATVDIFVYNDTPIKKMELIINDVTETNKSQLPTIYKGPIFNGLLSLPSGQLYYRVTLFVDAGLQVDVQSKLLTLYLEAMAEEGIDLPNTPVCSIPTPR